MAKLFVVTDQAMNAFFVRADDAAEAASKYETWRDAGNIENPAARAVVEVRLVGSPDAADLNTPWANYLD